jgi:hypothetical protein
VGSSKNSILTPTSLRLVGATRLLYKSKAIIRATLVLLRIQGKGKKEKGKIWTKAGAKADT